MPKKDAKPDGLTAEKISTSKAPKKAGTDKKPEPIEKPKKKQDASAKSVQPVPVEGVKSSAKIVPAETGKSASAASSEWIRVAKGGYNTKADTREVDVANINSLLQRRMDAKARKDYAAADSMALQLQDLGIAYIDEKKEWYTKEPKAAAPAATDSKKRKADDDNEDGDEAPTSDEEDSEEDREDDEFVARMQKKMMSTSTSSKTPVAPTVKATKQGVKPAASTTAAAKAPPGEGKAAKKQKK